VATGGLTAFDIKSARIASPTSGVRKGRSMAQPASKVALNKVVREKGRIRPAGILGTGKNIVVIASDFFGRFDDL
jgi:hypothetical protein